MRARITGGHAWVALAAAILVYEITAPAEQLLTDACARGMRSHPALTRAAILVTSAHLLGVLPAVADPFTWTARTARHFRLAQAAAVPTT